MIVSHRAPSSLNTSSYRAIWTHFKPIFVFFGQNDSSGDPKQIFLKIIERTLLVGMSLSAYLPSARRIFYVEP